MSKCNFNVNNFPASVASAERSFKESLRSKMYEDILPGLALLHVHYGEPDGISMELKICLLENKEQNKKHFVFKYVETHLNHT